MTLSRTIVVGVDASQESRQALRWACQEAHRRGLDVLAVAVWGVFPVTLEPLVGSESWRNTNDNEKVTRATLAALVAEVTGDFPQVELTQKVLAGRPAEQLITLSAGAAMLVVGAQGHGGFMGMLLGSTSRHVLTHSKCTVVIVRGLPPESVTERTLSDQPDTEPTPTPQTVVGVDGSAASEQALRWACEHASADGKPAEVLVVCVRTIAPLPEDLSIGAWPWRDSDPKEPVRVMLEGMAQTVGGEFPAVRIRRQILHGHPVDELLRLSEEADLLVVGSRGHGAIAGLLLGSVSRRLVNHSHCSVAVVR